MPGFTRPRTWRNVGLGSLSEIRAKLVQLGALEDPNLRNPSEAWRLRHAGSVFTAYSSGTLYCNGGEAPELEILYGMISELADQTLERPDQEVLIGLDETGKGEVLGHAALGAVRAETRVLSDLDRIVGSIDTKQRKSFSFWDGVIRGLESLRGRGFEYEVETLPPWDIDRYNINKILDVVYQRLLVRITRSVDLARVRVVVDDYGVGRILGEYLESLGAAGASIRVEAKADAKYPEVRAASIVAKWKRELAMKGIAERFGFPDQGIGSGNAGDPTTLGWLRRWKASGNPWPWFVKRSFRTIQELDGEVRVVKKTDPPIRHELLSETSRELFREGKLSTGSLTVVCPSCGTVSTAVKLVPAPAEAGLIGRCLSCSTEIPNLDTTLRYYCGIVVPDTSVIVSGAISTDLDQKGFFGGFTFLIPTVVARETDQPGGRRELGRMGDFAAMGRIGMVAVESAFPIEAAARDSAIIQFARDQNAILTTRDSGMSGNAIAKRVFCLTFRVPDPLAGDDDE